MPSRRPRDGARPYTRSGLHVVSRALPHLTERVADASIAEDALSPVERAARAWRRDVLADLGGLEVVSAARLALLDAVVGSVIVLHSLDAFLFQMASEQGLASRKYRRAFPIVADRMRVADSLARQLQVLGLERVPRPVPTLAEVLAQPAQTAPADAETPASEADVMDCAREESRVSTVTTVTTVTGRVTRGVARDRRGDDVPEATAP